MDMNETTNTAARKIEALGKRQRNVLRELANHGKWTGHGWQWENFSTTNTVLASMLKYGLVEIVEVADKGDYRMTGEFRPTREVEMYFTGGYKI